ncbi:MAG TPA: hypothetical protein VK638_45070, partial [Edaphobacter sp.]|nr:hypothetical protein [Edaphobacter sp.]
RFLSKNIAALMRQSPIPTLWLTDSPVTCAPHDKHLTVVYSDLSREGEGPADPASKERMHRVEEASGLGIRTVARLPGNIGLLDLAYFSDDPEAAAALDGAMAILHGSDALIIDLRRNMGRNPVMVDRLLT